MSQDQERNSSSEIQAVADWVKRLPYGQQFIGGLVLVLMILAGWILMSDLGTVAKFVLLGLIIVAIVVVLVVATCAFILLPPEPPRRGPAESTESVSERPGTQAEFDLNQYLRGKIGTWNELRMFAHRDISTSQIVSPTLEQLYVHMHTEQRRSWRNSLQGSTAREFTEMPGEHGDGRDAPPLSVLEALSVFHDNVYVLHGRPGIGKSSVVRYLCLSLAKVRLQGERFDSPARLPGWTMGALLPVLIPLWRLAQDQQATLGRRESVEEFLRSPVYHEDLPDSAREQARAAGDVLLRCLKESGGMVVFDGLDEVPTEQSRQLCRGLHEFCRESQYSTKSNEASTLSGRPSSRRPSSCQKTRAKVFK